MEWNYESKKAKRGIIVIAILVIIATIIGICSVCLLSQSNQDNSQGEINKQDSRVGKLKKMDAGGTPVVSQDVDIYAGNTSTVKIEYHAGEVGENSIKANSQNYNICSASILKITNDYIYVNVKGLSDGITMVEIYMDSTKIAQLNVTVKSAVQNIRCTLNVGDDRNVIANAGHNIDSSKLNYSISNTGGTISASNLKVVNGYSASISINAQKVGTSLINIYEGDPVGGCIAIIYVTVVDGTQPSTPTPSNPNYPRTPDSAPSVSPASGKEINLKPGYSTDITLDYIDRFDNVYTENTYVANFTCNKESNGYYQKLSITANSNVSSNTYCYVGLDNYGNPAYTSYDSAHWKINVYPDVQVDHPTETIHINIGETKSFKLTNATYYNCEIRNDGLLGLEKDIVTVNDDDKQYLKITGNKVGTTNVIVKKYGNPLNEHTDELVYKIQVVDKPQITYADKKKIQIVVGETATRWFKPTGYATLDYHFSNSKTSSIATTKTLDMDEDGKIDNIQVVGKKVGKDYLTWEAKDASGNNQGATVTWEVEVVPALKCTITPQTEVISNYGLNYTNKNQVVYKFEFEDNVEGFTKSDIALTGGGTISSFNKMSDKIYIVTVTNPADAYYSQKISINTGACHAKSDSSIKNKSASYTVFVDRIKPAIKNVKASIDTSTSTGTMLVAKGSVINVTFDIEEEKIVASNLLDKNDMEFVSRKDGVSKTFKPNSVVCSGKKYTVKWKVPNDVEEGSSINFNVTGVDLIVDFAGNECDEYNSVYDSGFRIIKVDSTVPEIDNIQYFVYNNGERDYGEDKVIHVSEGSQVRVRVHYNQSVVPSNVAFLTSGNSRDYKVVDNYNKGTYHDYTFTVTSVLKPGEVTALIQGCVGVNGVKCGDSSFVEDSNGYKLICDNDGETGETGDGPVKYKTFTYNYSDGKRVGNRYYAKNGDTVGTTIYFTDRFDDDKFTAKLGNAVGKAVYQETGTSGNYDTFFTLGEEEEGPIKLTVEGFVQDVEKDWDGVSYVIDNTKPTIENFAVRGYQKDSIYVEFEEKDNMSLPNDDLTANDITVKVGDTQCTNVIVKRITDEVEEAESEEEQEAQYDENAENGEVSAVKSKKYEVVINGIQNAGNVSFAINSVKDMAGNEISFEQENLEFVNPETAAFKKASCVVKRDGTALTGETKYMKNGDVIEFYIEFTGELLQTPTIYVSGAQCNVEQVEDNKLRYIATYTFNKEDEIPQGAIKFYMNDMISQNGIRLTNMRKTLDTFVYDSISPEIKDVEIKSTIDEDSKVTMKFKLVDDNLDVNTEVKKSNIKVLVKGEEIDASKYTLTQEDDQYTLVIDGVKYIEPYLVKIESTAENVIEDFSQNELTSFSTTIYIDDKTEPTMSVVRSVEVGEKTDKDIKLTITAEDKESGIKSIAVNGEKVEIKDGKAVYTATENGQYEIVVTNNAGLTASKTETIAEISRTEYRSESGKVADDGTGDDNNGNGSNGQENEGNNNQGNNNEANKDDSTNSQENNSNENKGDDNKDQTTGKSDGTDLKNIDLKSVDSTDKQTINNIQKAKVEETIEQINKEIPKTGKDGICVIGITIIGIIGYVSYKKYKEI